jgi:5-methylcytosine-specific restriction endonuclease McrA
LKSLSAASRALEAALPTDSRDVLEYVRSLLSHELPSGDAAQVIDRALRCYAKELEKRKFAATTKLRRHSRGSSGNARYIPAHVKRAVWERDQGRCTFVGEHGHRCGSRRVVEYDHIDPVARGGRATVESVRLLCRAHNQYEAERVFGVGFMEEKREQARRAKEARERQRAAAEAQAHAAALAKERANEVIPYLRRLGFNADESRRAAEYCESIPDSPLEERVRRALSYFRPPARTVSASHTMMHSQREVGAQPSPA